MRYAATKGVATIEASEAAALYKIPRWASILHANIQK